jgi:hypothetical protein
LNDGSELDFAASSFPVPGLRIHLKNKSWLTNPPVMILFHEKSWNSWKIMENCGKSWQSACEIIWVVSNGDDVRWHDM